MDGPQNERDVYMASRRLILVFLPLLLNAEGSFDEYKERQNKSFKQDRVKFIDYRKEEEQAFKSYRLKEQKAIAAYKEKLKAFWPEADLGNEKKLVNYSKDLHTKTVIDFKNNEVTVSQISPAKKISEEELVEKLNRTLSLDNKKAFKESGLEQEIDRISRESKYVKKASLDRQPLLPLVSKKRSVKREDITFVKKGNLYQARYKLPKDATYQRSFNYLVSAKSNARRFNLQAQWLLAIMHSESSFNPMARSWVPAYGLMQIVPRTAGIDAYQFLYKKRRLLSASYLYNTRNNIETGSAYFHILYYKYLSSIKNPTSRLYCAIAGYNTGAGNVARAFVGTNSVKQASSVINRMSPEEVYAHLLQNLKYDEPKHYLRRVRARSMKYKELYRL